MPNEKPEGNNACPYTGKRCSEFGSGHCDNERVDNPSNRGDD